jgi:hypothetical protein
VRNVRKGDNCGDGKSNRDADEGVLPTLCTRCETREGPFASGQKHCDSGKEEEGAFDLETRTNFTTFCKHKVVENNYRCWQNVVRTSERQNVRTAERRQNVRNVRKGDNCWDGKSNRDADEGVLKTLCTRCETREGPFASGQKHCDSGKEEEGSFDLEKRTNFNNILQA